MSHDECQCDACRMERKMREITREIEECKILRKALVKYVIKPGRFLPRHERLYAIEVLREYRTKLIALKSEWPDLQLNYFRTVTFDLECKLMQLAAISKM